MKAGDRGEKTHEQRMQLMPNRLRLELLPMHRGEIVNKLKEIHVLHTEGDIGKKNTSSVILPISDKILGTRESAPNSQEKSIKKSEKCHPDTANRCARPFFWKEVFKELGRGVPRTRLEAKSLHNGSEKHQEKYLLASCRVASFQL